LILSICLLGNKVLLTQETNDEDHEEHGRISYFMHTNLFMMELTNEIAGSNVSKGEVRTSLLRIEQLIFTTENQLRI
jgi:hypothetical protein